MVIVGLVLWRKFLSFVFGSHSPFVYLTFWIWAVCFVVERVCCTIFVFGFVSVLDLALSSSRYGLHRFQSCVFLRSLRSLLDSATRVWASKVDFWLSVLVRSGIRLLLVGLDAPAGVFFFLVRVSRLELGSRLHHCSSSQAARGQDLHRAFSSTWPVFYASQRRWILSLCQSRSGEQERAIWTNLCHHRSEILFPPSFFCGSRRPRQGFDFFSSSLLSLAFSSHPKLSPWFSATAVIPKVHSWFGFLACVFRFQVLLPSGSVRSFFCSPLKTSVLASFFSAAGVQPKLFVRCLPSFEFAMVRF
jgi:hypothetical protein